MPLPFILSIQDYDLYTQYYLCEHTYSYAHDWHSDDALEVRKYQGQLAKEILDLNGNGFHHIMRQLNAVYHGGISYYGTTDNITVSDFKDPTPTQTRKRNNKLIESYLSKLSRSVASDGSNNGHRLLRHGNKLVACEDCGGLLERTDLGEYACRECGLILESLSDDFQEEGEEPEDLYPEFDTFPEVHGTRPSHTWTPILGSRDLTEDYYGPCLKSIQAWEVKHHIKAQGVPRVSRPKTLRAKHYFPSDIERIVRTIIRNYEAWEIKDLDDGRKRRVSSDRFNITDLLQYCNILRVSVDNKGLKRILTKLEQEGALLKAKKDVPGRATPYRRNSDWRPLTKPPARVGTMTFNKPASKPHIPGNRQNWNYEEYQPEPEVPKLKHLCNTRELRNFIQASSAKCDDPPREVVFKTYLL